MADNEWAESVGQLDLGAYLRRIGFTGSIAPTEESLYALHRAHLATIPFENLDILLGRGVRVDMESIQAKLVAGRRGGYCFEHGQLFAAALERIGFSVDRLLARVDRGPGAPMGPRTHLTLRVRTPDRSGVWLSDVGFGSSPPAPLSLRRLRSGAPQVVDGWIYEIAPEDVLPAGGEGGGGEGGGGEGGGGEGLRWALRELQGDEWGTLYRFEDVPVYPADVVLGNHYTSTHPDSWFTQQPIAVRRTPEAIASLVGRTYTVTRAGHVKERRELTDREWEGTLREVFGLKLPREDIAVVLAKAPSA
jgi:N-hydroxyarylamine O-acetyltransferase